MAANAGIARCVSLNSTQFLFLECTRLLPQRDTERATALETRDLASVKAMRRLAAVMKKGSLPARSESMEEQKSYTLAVNTYGKEGGGRVERGGGEKKKMPT